MIPFDLEKSIEVLERTPSVLDNMLRGLSDEWINNNEGPETWRPYDIVGHLIHGEKTDWIPRMEIILSDQEDKTFEPFDRFAQFRESKGKSLDDLLNEFRSLRMQNIQHLRSRKLSEEDLAMKGIHPDFKEVTLRELLSTWTVHDLNHISQISRVMSSQYKPEVGPWRQFLGILKL